MSDLNNKLTVNDWDKLEVVINLYCCKKCFSMISVAYHIKLEKYFSLKGNADLAWLCEACFDKYVRRMIKERVVFI